jgi:hypothetical protein
MPLPKFEEYVHRGIVKKQMPDTPRARFLIECSEKAFIGLTRRMRGEKLDEFNANSIIKECHDIILELIRAKMFLSGFSASGNFSHEAEVSYLRTFNFEEKEIEFMNELRYLRNGIVYYGKILDADYAKRVFEFTKSIRIKLLKLLDLK